MFLINIVYCDEITIYFIGYSELKPIKLKLVIENNDFKKPSIQYYEHKNKITLTYLKDEELMRNDGRPSLFQQEWEEVYNNKKTGRYIMVSQGAVVYQFTYIRYNDMKVFTFEQDTEEW